ncbi:MAG: hypothetical protein JXR51_10440 [Bacteroidales bacterium]|nr:hypothetical protein [Bacteroidales bacterium]MBN2757584.1 hypothetical protein [Bacteroidales bacterium]
MKKILFFALLIIFSKSANVYSQLEKGDSYFSVYGLLVPSKVDYVKDLGIDNSFIKLGYGIGFEKTNAIGSSGLAWATSLNFIMQPFNEDKIIEMIEDEGNVDADNVDFKFNPIFNISLTTGLKFQHNIVDKLDFYVHTLAGVNILKMGSWNTGSEEIDFQVKPTFAINLGAGFIIYNRFNLGIRYLMLGEPEIEETTYLENGETESESLGKAKLNMLTFALGVNF